MTIRRLSLGTVQFGVPYGVANESGLPAAEVVDGILSLALDAGVQSLDTAASYGLAEERIGRFIRRRGCEDSFEICTKFNVLGDGVPDSALAGLVGKAVETSLRKLSVPYVDEYLLHDSSDLRRYGGALVDALLAQRERGRVQRLGVSVYEPDDLVLLEDYPELDIVQHPMSVFDQRLLAADRLGELHAGGYSIHARSLFLQGLLALPPSNLPQHVGHARDMLLELHGILRDWNVTPTEASLQFVCEADVDKIVVGVDSADHLQKNLDTIARRLPAELLVQLSEAFPEVSATIIDPRTWATAE
jgi:aryl-alcohol dehydrogenase-like predicted oxidoreductase